MADAEVPHLLANIHRTLELIAFLLAVLVATQGGVALVVGASAVILLALNALTRYVDSVDVPELE